MCIIIDVNFFTQLTAEPSRPEFATVIEWLEQRGGKLVFGGRLKDEFTHNHKIIRYVLQLLAAGRAREVDGEAIDVEERTVGAIGHVSDDPHVLALARVGGVRTLCSYDRDLQRDFRTAALIQNPRGCVYTQAAHRPLLKHLPRCA